MTADDTAVEVSALDDLHRIVMLVNSGGDLDDVLRAAVEGVTQGLGFWGPRSTC